MRLTMLERLGLPALYAEWRSLFTTQYLIADLFAGITVAFVAIPLSLAIALASDVPPATGLCTAIVAGIVCALFGGSKLTVSGPAAAMSVLLADTVERFGIEALAMICLLAGLMQLLSGLLGLGKLSRYVPLPVIAGFTAGIGVIILIGQLPRAFGLMPPAESNIFDVFHHIKEYFHEINGVCLFLVGATIAIIRLLPKLFPKVPPILPAVAFGTLLVMIFNLDEVPLIGNIPNTLPTPHLPTMPSISIYELILSAFTIYLLASLETLLSASAIDKLQHGKKFDSNQELIGQGLGNICVAMFSGMPVTGVIARSATNIRAGAKTRRASIFHSLIMLLTVFSIAPYIGLIPIAALAGVLFSVAFSMINYKEFYDLWKTAKSEALIYAITFFTIIFVDLIAGVQAGMVAACVIFLLKAAKNRLVISSSSQDGILRLTLTGPLTFLSVGKIEKLEKRLETIIGGQTVVLDLSSITNIDTSGAGSIVEIFNQCVDKKIHFYIKGLARSFEKVFKNCGGSALIDHCYVVSEHELKEKDVLSSPKSSRGRLIHGIHQYYLEQEINDKRLFEYITSKQNPHTLFITCSDSRIIPSLITSADPGELFIIRNVGNFIPPYDPHETHSEAAAIEFALTQLNITDIVICGHANCGAMRACQIETTQLSPPHLAQWIAKIKSQLTTDSDMPLNALARQNVLNQVQNLRLYPAVQDKLAYQSLSIHAWFFDFDKSLVYEWNHHRKDFMMITPELAMST